VLDLQGCNRDEKHAGVHSKRRHNAELVNEPEVVVERGVVGNKGAGEVAVIVLQLVNKKS
tara:strand:- start:463 stop:642 length:180 start_codon:yes stop_codon:yes gene_type:complete